MNRQALALGVLLAAPLGAQSFEVGLFLGQQQYPSQSYSGHGPAPGGTVDTDSQTVYGLRFGYTVTDLGLTTFQLTAGFQPESSTPVYTGAELKESHWSLGGMFNFKTLVAMGVGLEYRLERLSENAYGSNLSTTENRIWARLNAGYVIPGPVAKLFLGAEVAFPFTTSTNQQFSPFNPDTFKALAPKNQFGLYAGLRF